LIRYTDIFFDLDRTLWDFDRNSAETLTELFEIYGLKEELGIDFFTFMESFRKINASAWRDFRQGNQSKEEMRTNRFLQTFNKYGSSDWKMARKMSLDYIEICPYKGHLIEGAEILLEKLQPNHSIHIITNGFSDTQRIKINSSGLAKYLSEIIISDETPYRKPDTAIFNLALKKCGGKKDSSLMIGDDWQKDIQGARRSGINQVFFNPEDIAVLEKGSTTYVIKRLCEIDNILNPAD